MDPSPERTAAFAKFFDDVAQFVGDAGHLARFALERKMSAISETRHSSRTSPYKLLERAGHLDDATEGLIVELIEWWWKPRYRDVAAQNARELLLQLEAWSPATELLPVLSKALDRDLANYHEAAEDPDSVPRERIYWLAVALCDLRYRETNGSYAAVLQDVRSMNRRAYRSVYSKLIGSLEREATVSLDVLQSQIDALLEGYVVRERIGPSPAPAEVAGAVLGLLYAGTKPFGAITLDLDAAIRGIGPTAPPAPLSTDAAYYAVIAAFEEADERGLPETVDVVSMHGHAEHTDLELSEAAKALGAHIDKRVRDGWRARRIVAVSYPERLATVRAQLVAIDQKGLKLEVRGYTRKSIPLMAPIIIGGQISFLGVEDSSHYGIETAARLNEPAATSLCREYFDRIWTGEGSHRLRTHAGMRYGTFDELARELGSGPEKLWTSREPTREGR